MKIGIITTHSYPIPTPTHTGDIVILDLAFALDALGHKVDVFAPEGTHCPPNGRLFSMRCSNGSASPPSWACEESCYIDHADVLREEDIVHDFSITKRVVERLVGEGKTNVISTLLGGTWGHPNPPMNIALWSKAMRDRGLRGATDYEGTPTPDMGGPSQTPIKDARVVYGGIDTSYYSPSYQKGDSYLWMNRWHVAKGYHVAIDIARKTGIELVMAGEHPDNERFDYQRNCANEAVSLAADLPNVKFEWLPADPYHHDAKRELYRKAKALLYTVQFQEPFGLSQAESLACGTPVIGINFGSVPELIEDGLTGFVRSNDIDDLSSSLELVDQIDPKVCRDEAVKRFDRSVMAKSYLDQYQAIISGESWGL